MGGDARGEREEKTHKNSASTCGCGRQLNDGPGKDKDATRHDTYDTTEHSAMGRERGDAEDQES